MTVASRQFPVPRLPVADSRFHHQRKKAIEFSLETRDSTAECVKSLIKPLVSGLDGRPLLDELFVRRCDVALLPLSGLIEALNRFLPEQFL